MSHRQLEPRLGGAGPEPHRQARPHADPLAGGGAAAVRRASPRTAWSALRDRALIGVLIYSFARISAAFGLRVEDYFSQGKRWWLRLHEKGGKNHEMPVHHTARGVSRQPTFGRRGSARIRRGRSFGQRSTKNGVSPTSLGAPQCLGDDPAAGESGRRHDTDRLPHLPGDRDHHLPHQRRHPREGADDGRAFEPTHDQAL